MRAAIRLEMGGGLSSLYVTDTVACKHCLLSLVVNCPD